MEGPSFFTPMITGREFPKCFPHNAQNIEVYELQKFAEMTLPEPNSEFAPKKLA